MTDINFNDPRFQEALLKQARSSPRAVRSTRDLTRSFADQQTRRSLQMQQLGLQSQLMKARMAEGAGRLELAKKSYEYNKQAGQDRLAAAKKSFAIQTLMGLGGAAWMLREGNRRRKLREVEMAKQEKRDNDLAEQLAIMRSAQGGK